MHVNEPAFVIVGVAIIATVALLYTNQLRQWFWPSTKVALIVVGSVVLAGGLGSYNSITYLILLGVAVLFGGIATIWNFIEIRRKVRQLRFRR
jgi:uncharacterized membrane protein HdeD (DUF308 family)